MASPCVGGFAFVSARAVCGDVRRRAAAAFVVCGGVWQRAAAGGGLRWRCAWRRLLLRRRAAPAARFRGAAAAFQTPLGAVRRSAAVFDAAAHKTAAACRCLLLRSTSCASSLSRAALLGGACARAKLRLTTALLMSYDHHTHRSRPQSSRDRHRAPAGHHVEGMGDAAKIAISISARPTIQASLVHYDTPSLRSEASDSSRDTANESSSSASCITATRSAT